MSRELLSKLNGRFVNPEIKPFVGKKTVLYKGEVETRNTAFGGTNAIINCKLFDIKDYFHRQSVDQSRARASGSETSVFKLPLWNFGHAMKMNKG